MDCSEHQAQFTVFLDGDLATEARDRLQAHLKECLNCYRRWCLLQETQRVLNQLPELDPPEHLGALTMARLKRRRFPGLSWLSASIPRWIPVGIGVAALLFTSVALWRSMPSRFFRQSLESSSHKSTTSKGTAARQPEARFTGSQRSYSSDGPVMVLKVKDFSRVDQELESVLRSFSQSMLPRREPARSVRSSSARLIDFQISGQQFPRLIRELGKMGHLDHAAVDSHKLASSNRPKSISIRIVVVSNGKGTEIWQEGKSYQKATGSEQFSPDSKQ